jgi:hypothetical protein
VEEGWERGVREKAQFPTFREETGEVKSLTFSPPPYPPPMAMQTKLRRKGTEGVPLATSYWPVSKTNKAWAV